MQTTTTKFTIDKISFDDGKTWSDVHFIDESKYPAPEIHPTGGHGNIIHKRQEGDNQMTFDRVIEILDPEHRENYESIEPVEEACRMGMKALKRQLPIKPRCDIACPICGRVAIYENFCPDCGQAIDWSDNNERL